MSTNDLEKANLIHQIEQAFDLTPEVLELLTNQIKNPKVVNSLERIYAGLTIEDSYHYVASALPWVKNIHPLHQKQELKYKQKYQIPDYNLLIENNKKFDFPLLIDVKTARGEKETCKIQKKQLITLKNYANSHNVSILVAIYWEKYQYWTHNTLEHFGTNSKISFNDAIANDLSHIISDYMFLFEKEFYRKSYFNINTNDKFGIHEKYGSVSDALIGLDLDSLEKIDPIEALIIDSLFTLTEIEYSQDSLGTYLIEKFELSGNCLGLVIKTSLWTKRVLDKIGIPLNERIEKANNMLATEFIRIHIVELAKRLDATLQYQIPVMKNATTDKLYQLAYSDSDVFDNYKQN